MPQRDIDAKDKQISKHFLKTDVTFLFPSFRFYHNETYFEEYNIRDLFIEILCEIALNS